MDLENTSVEMQEVAETAEPEESVETQEVAEPEQAETPEVETPKKNDADAAFAQYRRENAALRAQLQAAEADAQRYEEALGLFFEGNEDKALQAESHYSGRPIEEVRADYEARARQSQLEADNRVLSQAYMKLQADAKAREAYEEIRRIDPSVKSTDDLPEDLGAYVHAGLTPVQAYYASKAAKDALKVDHPEPIGRVKTAETAKEYYSREEVEQMSSAERKKHLKAIRSSMQKW